MNFKDNNEPEMMPEFNLQHISHMMNFYHVPKMYLAYFGKVPSYYTFEDHDIAKFHKEFSAEFEEYILGKHFRKCFAKADHIAEIIYVLHNKILVEQEPDEINVYFEDENSVLLHLLLSFLSRYKKVEPNNSHINLIISQSHGLDNKKISFKKPKINFETMYNDDFPGYHQRILKSLQENNKSGLHLLYGKPGTGKSTYIRYLCGLVKKEIIFLPGQLAQNLDNVAMTKYLIDNPNTILVIEDAEELIVSRDQQRNSNLAMILNITDGILGESLGIQIIATFNTDVKNIDPALKRKGRLKTSYEFKALPPTKANYLLQKAGFKNKVSDPHTLADIYNLQEEEQFVQPERKPVGFKINRNEEAYLG